LVEIDDGATYCNSGQRTCLKGASEPSALICNRRIQRFISSAIKSKPLKIPCAVAHRDPAAIVSLTGKSPAARGKGCLLAEYPQAGGR
jgi:hypothetical protein